jgi:iron complex transport system ATP-binding protein
MHDLSLACRYGDRLVAMRDGALVAAGRPCEIVTAEFVRDVFDVEAMVMTDPASGTPLVVPMMQEWSRQRS